MGFLPVAENSRGITQIIISTVFLALATLAVIARIWARRIKAFALAINDYAAIFALVWLYAMYGVITAMVVAAGQGQHQSDVPPGKVQLLLQLLICVEVTWAFSCAAVKISILDLYTRIFRAKRFCQACYGLMVLTGIFASIVILIAFLLCRPLRHFWDRSSEGTCGHQAIAFLSSGVLNLLIDLMVVVLPMRQLWHLQMTLTRKLSIMTIFGIGATICIISLIRIVALYQLDNTDLTYSNQRSALWTFIEPALSVINTCLPVLQPVIDKISKLFLAKSRSKRKSAWTESSAAAKKGSMLIRHGNPNNAEARDFKRLTDDHMYPLTEGTGTYNHISGPGSKETELEEPESVYDGDMAPRGINVQKNWEVKTSGGPSLFGNVPNNWQNDPGAGVPLPLPHGL